MKTPILGSAEAQGTGRDGTQVSRLFSLK